MRNFIKQIALIASTVFYLSACQGPSSRQVVSDDANAVKSPIENPNNLEARKTLPLPPFPKLPPAQTTLNDNQAGEIYFPIKSPYDFSRVLSGYDTLPETTGKGTLVLPDNATAHAPVPAMVILHGSGGIAKGREFEYAKLFAQNGIASFIVDYYTPRGVMDNTPYVMKTMITTEVDIMSDAYSALKILGTHPAIDAARIGVTGYSYGGMATRYVMDKRLKEIMAPDIAPFALHMDIYGPCHQTLGHTATTGAPYLAIHGDADNTIDVKLCQSVYKDLEAGGSSVESHVIRGAGHGWENAQPISQFSGGFVHGCKFSFDHVDGTFLVDGKQSRFQPQPDMNRNERAYVRSTLGELVGGCVGQGYTVGNNPAADALSKAWQLDFMRREFGL